MSTIASAFQLLRTTVHQHIEFLFGTVPSCASSTLPATQRHRVPTRATTVRAGDGLLTLRSRFVGGRGPTQHMFGILGEALVALPVVLETLIRHNYPRGHVRALHEAQSPLQTRIASCPFRPTAISTIPQPLATMSQTPAESSARANYQSIFDNALQEHKKKTRKDLSSDPLFHTFQSCGSPDDIIAILRQQIPQFHQSASGSSDDRLTRWLVPTVKVINAFSATIGGAVALVGPTAYAVTRPEFAR